MTATTSGARLAHLGRLLGAYPKLPAEAIVKEDLLTEGVRFPDGTAPPEVAALEGGPLGLRRTIVRVRRVEDAPYRVQAVDGGQALVDAGSGEQVAWLRAYPRRPDYAARVFPGGRRYAEVLDPRGVAELPLDAPKDPWELAEAVAETFLLQPWQTGETPLCIRLAPDPAVGRLSEAEQDAFLRPYCQAILERLGRVRPVLLSLPPRSWAGEQRLLEAGVAGRHSTLGVWGREVFERIGPQVGLDWDTWVERLVAQVHIFLGSNTQPVLLVGKELSQPGGYPDLDTAARATRQGIKFLLDHRVVVRLARWWPPEGAGDHLRPPVEYFLDLDQYWYETWVAAHREEPGGEQMGPGRGRVPESAFLDIGRGAALATIRDNRRGGDGV